MNKLLKIVLGVVAAFGLAVGAIFYFTAGMVETADAFFEAVKRQDMAAAHGYLSEDFRASTDQAALGTFLSKSALLKFKEASWSNRQISGGRGDLDGSVTTETGGVVPLKFSFVKENDVWKIYSIQKPTAGVQVEATSQTVPTSGEQIALVKESTRAFVVSIDNKSMAHFRSTTSQLWQKQTTTEQLDGVFGSMYGLNLNVLNGLEPVLEPVPSLGENGELVLKGYYPTMPKHVLFEQSYTYEGVAWKLFGFKIRTA